MKKMFFALAALAMVGCSGKAVVINGAVENLNDGYVYLADAVNGGAVIDSAAVSGGKFRLALNNAEPTFALIRTDNNSVITYLFVEEGTTTVSGNLSDDTSIRIGGTTANEALDAFVKRSSELRESYRNTETKEAAEEIGKMYEEFMERSLEENKDNLFGVYLFINQKGYELSGAEMLAHLNSLPEALRETALVKSAAERAERKMKVEPQAEGSDYVPHYIEIVQPDVNGNEISLSSVVENPKNRYVLVDFWASWCGPCMGEVPELVEAYKKYHDKGLEIYGVSFDRNAEKWQGALKDKSMTWINVSLLSSFNNQAAEDYVVEAIPTNYLIDCSNGVIIAKNLRGEDVAAKFAELFK